MAADTAAKIKTVNEKPFKILLFRIAIARLVKNDIKSGPRNRYFSNPNEISMHAAQKILIIKNI